MEAKQDAAAREVALDLSPFLIVYKDGSIHRLDGNSVVPPLQVPGQVNSKDVVYSSEHSLRCRVFLPATVDPGRKLPLLVYYHGGGFSLGSPFSPIYHNYVVSLVEEANVVAVSVDYRLAPEHVIPAAYEDSWSALKWVASHAGGDGSEEWLNSYADFSRVFLAGDSAGANICHHMITRNKKEEIQGMGIVGCVLIHPFFWGKEAIGNEPTEPENREFPERVWQFASPASDGCNDARINPHLDADFGSLSCRKLLVIVAELDVLRDRGLHYSHKLKESGWDGAVELMEVEGEHHVFHLNNAGGHKAVAMRKRIASFIAGS